MAQPMDSGVSGTAMHRFHLHYCCVSVMTLRQQKQVVRSLKTKAKVCGILKIIQNKNTHQQQKKISRKSDAVSWH